MANKLVSFLLGRDAENGSDFEKLEMAAVKADEFPEVVNELTSEVKKLEADKRWIEERLRSDIEMHREFNNRLKTQLEAREAEIVQLKKDVEEAKASAISEANSMIARAGHDPVAIDQTQGGFETEDEKIEREYKDLPAGPERIAFRQKHAAAFERLAQK